MKTIGLIGGLSPQSTILYYDLMNRYAREQKGDLTSADILIASVNQQEILELRLQGKWDRVGEILTEKAILLQNAGADFVLIACNSVHHVADQVENALKIPFLHIADSVAMEIRNRKISKVGLLGTNFTMKMDFYSKRIANYGIETVIPIISEDCDAVNSIIFDELCKGIIKESSKLKYIEIINKIKKSHDIEGVILGCTEIGLLVKQQDISEIGLVSFESAEIHARFAVNFSNFLDQIPSTATSYVAAG